MWYWLCTGSMDDDQSYIILQQRSPKPRDADEGGMPLRKWKDTLGALALLLALMMSAPALGGGIVTQEIFLEGTCHGPLVLRNGNLLLPLNSKKGPGGELLDKGNSMARLVCQSAHRRTCKFAYGT